MSLMVVGIILGMAFTVKKLRTVFIGTLARTDTP